MDDNTVNEMAMLGRRAGETITDEMVAAIPPVEIDGARVVPDIGVQAVGELITSFAAEVLYAYHDAGSERDVTMEDLGPAVLLHVHSWSETAAKLERRQEGYIAGLERAVASAVEEAIKAYETSWGV